MKYLENKSYYETVLKREIKYVSDLSLKCGAIGMFFPAITSYNDYSMPTVDGVSPEEYTTWNSVKVVPYFSDAAVAGIMEADRVLGTTDGKDIALNYINWYISHMNTKESDVNGLAGTVYDYFVFESNDGRTVEVSLYDANSEKYPTGNPYDYDSTDSYAAMFLELLLKYTELYDSEFLNGKSELIDSLVEVLIATYKSAVELTIAKPSYAVCYLMDNCEVFCGLESAEKIYTQIFRDSSKAENARKYADKIKNAILTRMWDSKDNCFCAAIFPDGKPAYENDLTVFYPQATCQLFPLIFGIIDKDDEKAKVTYERFKQDFCQADTKGKNWSVFNVEGETYPWCIVLRACVKMEDYETAQKFINAMYKRFIAGSHAYPYYNSESGSVMLAVSKIYEILPDDITAEESSETYQEESANVSEVTETPENSSEQTAEKGKSALPYIIAGACVAAAAIAAAIMIKRRKKK